MTFREYLENLNKFAKENPETLDMICVYASDDEGNSYNRLIYTPTKGYLDENDEWSPEDNYEVDEIDHELTNSVCIN